MTSTDMYPERCHCGAAPALHLQDQRGPVSLCVFHAEAEGFGFRLRQREGSYAGEWARR